MVSYMHLLRFIYTQKNIHHNFLGKAGFKVTVQQKTKHFPSPFLEPS